MKREKIVKLTKILVLIFMSLTFVNILLPDSFVIGIHRLNPEGIRLSVFQMIIRWFNFSSFVILPVAVYFDKKIFNEFVANMFLFLSFANTWYRYSF